MELGRDIGSNKTKVPPRFSTRLKTQPTNAKGVDARSWEKRHHAIASTEFLVLRPTHIDRRFLKHLFLSPLMSSELVARATGTTRSHQRVRAPDVLAIPVGLPPLPEQRKIAAILSSVDDAIEKTQGGHRPGAGRQARPDAGAAHPGPAGAAHAVQADGDWNDSQFVGNSSAFRSGFFSRRAGVEKMVIPRPRNAIHPIIRCIKEDGSLDLANVQYISNEKANESYRHFFLEKNDTVLSSSGSLGRIAVVREIDLPLMLNYQRGLRFRALDEDICSTSYMRAFLNSEVFLRQILRESQGSAQPNFGPSHLRNVLIPLPSKKEQVCLAAAVNAPKVCVTIEAAHKEQLLKLKSALMSVLLSRRAPRHPGPRTRMTPQGPPA